MFCREFYSEHVQKFFWWLRHYCEVICSENTVYTCVIFPTSNLLWCR